MFSRFCWYILFLFVGITGCNCTAVAQSLGGNTIVIAKEYPADSISWLSPQFKKELGDLYELVENAGNYGLEKADYPLPALDLPVHDTPVVNSRIENVCRNFFNALAYGTRKPSFRYEGIHLPACRNIQKLVIVYARAHDLTRLADSLTESLQPLLERIIHYQALTGKAGFREVKITSKQADPSNKALVEKLYQLGFLPGPGKTPAAELKKAILQAQKGFDLLADEKIRSTFIEQLNVPLSTRLLQCRQALNDMRWLRCLAGQEETILINIPAAYMQVYRSGSIALEMRMVVGKRSTPTPTFTSRIQQVILYPYWHVPYSIATKELLPLIKMSPAFIDKGGYQVLNMQGKIMDPYRINWKALGPGNFPYLIRQSTGCDNALGLLKLEFYTPFGVYLHDTPSKNSFNLHKRYFSHGCMRMEKPMELGRMILQENTMAIDTVTAKGCITNQSPVPVQALHKMALVVWYNPAAIDPAGNVIFYEDVYKKF